MKSMLTSRRVIVFQVMWWFPVHNALLAGSAMCTGNNHDLYALVNVIFYVFTIFNVTNADKIRYKKCSTGLAVAQLAGGLQVFSFLTNIVELAV